MHLRPPSPPIPFQASPSTCLARHHAKAGIRWNVRKEPFCGIRQRALNAAESAVAEKEMGGVNARAEKLPGRRWVRMGKFDEVDGGWREQLLSGRMIPSRR